MKIKKTYIGCLVLLLGLFIIFISPKGKQVSGYSGDMNTHVFLDCKGKGDCNSLIGDVLITVVLVDDLDSKWTESDVVELKNEQANTTGKLVDEARSYGVELNVNLNYINCKIDDAFDVSDFSGWVSNALKAAGLPTEEEVISSLKDTYSVKEAPILFAINREGRSFAVQSNVTEGFEYAILYRKSGDYRHELFHLFGAKDYYFPEDVKRIAEVYFSNSKMMMSGDGEVDSLTAYLMGWNEIMSEEAKQFVNETAWVTQEYMKSAREKERVTGQGMVRIGDGTYTGELVGGIPHGKGKIVWDNGNTYEGEWCYGVANGYGTMMWNTKGVSYIGYWENWNMHGQGICIFADGTTMIGCWENNEFKE